MKLRSLLCTLMLMTFGLSARANAFLLTVDLTDPTDVTITATEMPSLVDSSSTSTYDGVDLVQFLTSAVVADPVVASGLIPSGATMAYDSWGTDSYSGPAVDLNLYKNEGSETQTFSASTPAFTGTWTGLDFSGFEGSLPSTGTYGDILAGYSGNPDQIIGQWVIVPEPSQYGYLLAFGLAGLIGYRRLSNRGAFRLASATSR